MELEEVEPDRQQIMVSRSFADRVEEHDAVAQPLQCIQRWQPAHRSDRSIRARAIEGRRHAHRRATQQIVG